MHAPPGEPPASFEKALRDLPPAAGQPGAPTNGKPGAGPRPTPAERALRLGSWGPPLPTGIPTIDSATRGGPRAGGMMVVGGAPGAGKTTLMMELAFSYASRGIPVTILAADEAADGLLIRLGQRLGLQREALEAGEHDTKHRLAEILSRWPHVGLFDADDDEVGVEDAVADLVERAAGGQGVLCADSVQRARSSASQDAPDDRRRVDAVVKALKGARRHGLLVVATSELSRAAYRSKRPAEQIEDMASFKESGGIEHAGHLLLVMRKHEGVVDVTMPKNRWGELLPFRLVLNHERASFVEVPLPPDGGPELNSEAQFDGDLVLGRRVLHENPGVQGKDRLRSLMKGISEKRRSAVIRSLEHAGEIVNTGTAKRPRLYLRGDEPTGSPESPHPTVGPLHLNPTNPPLPLGGEGCGEGSKGGSPQGDEAGRLPAAGARAVRLMKAQGNDG